MYQTIPEDCRVQGEKLIAQDHTVAWEQFELEVKFLEANGEQP